MPITPMGTLRFSMQRPFGRSKRSNTSPTGSQSPATCFSPSAIPAILSSVSRSLSSSPADMPFASPSATSLAFSPRIRPFSLTRASAAPCNARFFSSAVSFCSSYFARAAAFPNPLNNSFIPFLPFLYCQTALPDVLHTDAFRLI